MKRAGLLRASLVVVPQGIGFCNRGYVWSSRDWVLAAAEAHGVRLQVLCRPRLLVRSSLFPSG